MSAFLKTRLGWWTIFLAGLVPFIYLAYRVVINDLGVEPGKTVLEYLGETAFIFLLLTLAITPMKKVFGLSGFVRFRRMIGLFSLFFATLHVTSYGLFIVDWYDFLGSLYKRPYVVVGALAFSILIALGVTSPKSMVRRLGKRWKKLHRLVYLAALLVVVHVWWQSRSDFTEPLMYLAAFILLMVARVNFNKKLIAN